MPNHSDPLWARTLASIIAGLIIALAIILLLSCVGLAARGLVMVLCG